MAGTQPGFSATEFKDAIHFAMNMGLPNVEQEQATFYWETSRSFSKADSSGRAFTLKARPADVTERDPVRIPVAVDYARFNAGMDGTGAGQFDVTRATLTILDEDFESVRDADYVKLGGNRYVIDYVTPVGLFDVTVYEMHLRAWDES